MHTTIAHQVNIKFFGNPHFGNLCTRLFFNTINNFHYSFYSTEMFLAEPFPLFLVTHILKSPKMRIATDANLDHYFNFPSFLDETNQSHITTSIIHALTSAII